MSGDHGLDVGIDEADAGLPVLGVVLELGLLRQAGVGVVVDPLLVVGEAGGLPEVVVMVSSMMATSMT